MEGRTGRFRILSKDVARRCYVVQLWDAGGELLPTVLWQFEDLEQGEDLHVSQSLDQPPLQQRQEASAGGARGSAEWVEPGTSPLNWPRFQQLLCETGVTCVPRAWAWYRLLSVDGGVPAAELQRRLPLPSSRMTLLSGRAREQDEDEDASDEPGMDWEDFAEFMMELGVEDLRRIEEHWDSMNRDGRVRPSQALVQRRAQEVMRWIMEGEEAKVRKEQAEARERGRDDLAAIHARLRTLGMYVLRSLPRSDSAPATGGLISSGQAVELLSTEPQGDFVRVRARNDDTQGSGAAVQGWIHVDRLTATFDEQEYRLLTEEEWWNQAWTVSAEELGVWVRRHEDHDSTLKEELALAGEADDKVAAQRERLLDEVKREGHCTYVALSLGRPRKGHWRVCGTKCHITIGYAAPMDATQRQQLGEMLNEVVEGWVRLAPASRPLGLTRFRQFQLQTVEERDRERASKVGFGTCRSGSVACMSRVTLERYLQEDLVYTPHVPKDQTLQEVVRRTWVRDGEELRRAEARVLGLSTHVATTGELRLARASDGLGASHDIRDLLCYLGDAMGHWSSCFKRNPEGKLVRPNLTWESHWHMSWQDGWVRRDAPEKRIGGGVAEVTSTPALS